MLAVAGIEWSSPDVANIHGRVGVLAGLAALLTAVACEVVPSPICSDGVVAEEEECDDGNVEDGDGCSSGCQLEDPPRFCGDGTLDAGEACDDGNSIGSDGCSSICQFDDDARTPGDDRVGFLTCTNEEEGVSLTCSRGNGCCSEPTACRPNEFDCLSPFWFQACDGPEDCNEGEQCEAQDQYIGCTARAFGEVLCHTAADCILPESNPCLAGRCHGFQWQIPGYRQVCGDGVVDNGGELDNPELCDDGNTEDGDGCSSVCLPGLLEDDPNTPGDDRRGVVECMAPPEGLECGPGSTCCRLENQAGFQCDDGTEGLSCWSYSTCDGPEDCDYYPSQCVIDYSSSFCLYLPYRPTPDTMVRCHTNLDCVRPSVNPCIEGTCLALSLDPDPVCSDGVVADTEGCDDGNLVDGDGCSSRCQLEDPESLCGNGTIDVDEACDDGNTAGGDGCGSYCQLDDDMLTPGDDRAGFLTCSGEVATMTCRPGAVCCGQGTPGCAASAEQCSVPIGVVSCDGPEDCPADEQCWVQPKFTFCAVDPSRDPWIKCHTDADCPEPSENPCSGICYGDRRKGETFGDVRPGFIECGQLEVDRITCGPGTGCCTSGIIECAESIEQCEGTDGEPLRFDSCDGPEDCDRPGEQCWIDSTGSSCQLAEQDVYHIRCHVDADCVRSYANPCDDGSCAGRF